MHNDLPQWVQDEGGFLNQNIVKYFKLYADTVFQELGTRVKIWLTFNEPIDLCTAGYGSGATAPLVNLPGVGDYLCGHNTLLAHAAVYHLYKDIYAEDQRGMIGKVDDAPGRLYQTKF